MEESELFTDAELSELFGVAESVDDVVDLMSSFVRCASLVAWSFDELPRLTCANAGAAPSASAARIAIFMVPPGCRSALPGTARVGTNLCSVQGRGLPVRRQC